MSVTVKVLVNGQPQDFPAHFETQPETYFLTRGPQPSAGARLVPDEQEGWIFRETVSGQWIGTRTGT
jgi:hypothetical protein